MINADVSGSDWIKPEVFDYLKKQFSEKRFGNPNSNHFIGNSLFQEIEMARGTLCGLLSCDSHHLIFNGGATEGIRNVFYSFFEHHNYQDAVILYSPYEHSATLENVRYCRSKGAACIALAHEQNGLLDLAELKATLQACQGKAILVAVMAAHNETGVIQDYQQIAEVCHSYDAEYLCDTTQLIGKQPFDFERSEVDYAVASGHKFGALPGTGFLLVKNSWHFSPLLLGGGQESSLRAGTQNYLGIASMAIALPLAHQRMANQAEVTVAQRRFEQALQHHFPGTVIIGEAAPRVPGLTFCAIGGVSRETLQAALEDARIMVSSGSACSDRKSALSKVATGLGYSDEVAKNTLRFSLGYSGTAAVYSSLTETLLAVEPKALVA
ncbi:cysteine desulfurase family protein [Photobacterium galatheae]|uniref:cysteine desulfurase n=1 Tax=Photobacterium galatheae TaxID=1654360 RepID=A0A066S0F7_9GAMM|nr:aminotransferase class V-fold PLP-dependent enzyme [Photobacterium galatheae]KDM93123.1 hypothetical protein EA58_02725 [Photobacterium galatheae]MCM0148349.1 aminotransferase class V-fold PLP-dependent enzyme [Photobacterium galatheae]